jgi:RNA polymerase-binding transcription factor DksA
VALPAGEGRDPVAGPGLDVRLDVPLDVQLDVRAVQTHLAVVEARLDAVDDVLQRLDDGSHAHCARCGTPLEAARMAADPLVRTCSTSCPR